MIDVYLSRAPVLKPAALPNLSRASQSGQGEPMVVIDLADNGPGLAPPVLERLFEPFVTTRSTGSGLGLTIVRRAIDAHHGQLAFVSGAEGHKGTTCVIKLPLTGQAR